MSTTGSTQQQPEHQTKDDHDGKIDLMIRNQNGDEVLFSVKNTTTMGKIMTAYCTTKAVDKRTVKFLLDGMRVREDQKVGDLDIEDGEAIDCVMEQFGG